MIGNWVFDDRGNLVLESSYELRRMLPLKSYNGDLAADLIRNLGFIGLNVRTSHAEITLRSAVVSQVAYATLMFWIADHLRSPAIINDLSGSAAAELFHNPQQVFDRLLDLNNHRTSSKHCNETPRTASDLLKHNSMYGLLDKWRGGAHSRMEELERYANKRLAQRYIVVAYNDGEPAFQAIGTGVRTPDPAWRANALNTPLARQPDTGYWNWIISRQIEVVQKAKPFISDVSAEIYWPTSGWSNHMYRRLILPCLCADGSPAIFVANGGDFRELGACKAV